MSVFIAVWIIHVHFLDNTLLSEAYTQQTSDLLSSRQLHNLTLLFFSDYQDKSARRRSGVISSRGGIMSLGKHHPAAWFMGILAMLAWCCASADTDLGSVPNSEATSKLAIATERRLAFVLCSYCMLDCQGYLSDL